MASRHTYASLHDLRERYLGVSREQLARHSAIDPARLASLEADLSQLSAWEADRLAASLGIDEEALLKTPIRVAAGEGLAVLALQSEFQQTSAATKFAIVGAARAARDAKDLLALLDGDSDDARGRLNRRLADFRALAPGRDQLPFKRGQAWAERLRAQLGLGAEPIRSMRDLVRDEFPEIAVLEADLMDEAVSGVSFVDAAHGPTIVLNSRGKNRNACVRRFSLAHELAHVLIDWTRNDVMAALSGYLNENRLEVEQQANAFAARFLCPLPVLASAVAELPADKASQRLIGEYGLHFSAIRLSVAVGAVPGVSQWELPGVGAAGDLAARWLPAEDLGCDAFPLLATPRERRTLVAERAAQAYSKGLISRDRLATYLGVPVSAEVEGVLDWLGLDQPADE